MLFENLRARISENFGHMLLDLMGDKSTRRRWDDPERVAERLRVSMLTPEEQSVERTMMVASWAALDGTMQKDGQLLPLVAADNWRLWPNLFWNHTCLTVKIAADKLGMQLTHWEYRTPEQLSERLISLRPLGYHGVDLASPEDFMRTATILNSKDPQGTPNDTFRPLLAVFASLCAWYAYDRSITDVKDAARELVQLGTDAHINAKKKMAEQE